MKDVFGKLASDFFSTIIFLVLYLVTGNVPLATGVAIASALVQLVRARIKGEKLDAMSYGSLALVIVLGGATLLTNDPRFVLMKPSIGHFAIGAIMLKRDWMLRYMPAIVRDNAPEFIRRAGYGWALLMFAIGLGNIAVAMTGNVELWAFYATVVAFGAKILAFAVQYVILRVIISRKLRRAAASLPASQPTF